MQTAAPLLLAAVAIIAQAGKPQKEVSPTLAWGSARVATAYGDSITVDTATLTVPERHSVSNGKTITLPVLRLRSTASAPGSPIVYLAGGPGNSGVAELRNFDRYPIFESLRSLGDVILFDQRGTGGSRPSVVIPGRLDLPSDKPINDPSVIAGMRDRVTKEIKTLRDNGIDIDAYNTAENAHDVATLREAVGAQKISLWGHSYGSHLALAVLKLHGDVIDRVVIGGVNGLDQRWRMPADGDNWLRNIDSTIKADPLHRAVMPDFIGDVRRLLDRLESNPLHVNVQGKDVFVGRDEVAAALAINAGDITLVRRLPVLIARTNAGDTAPIAALVQQSLRDRPWGTAMSYSMHIASGVSSARAQRIAAESKTAILGNAINYPFATEGISEAFGIKDLGDAFRTAPRSETPALVFSANLDGRTSASDAQQATAGLTKSVRVVITGAGHNFYTSTPEVRERMLAFFRGQQVSAAPIAVFADMRGADEPKLVRDIQTVGAKAGIGAAVSRLREMSTDKSIDFTSYVAGTLATQLLSDPNHRADAVPLLKAALEIFPTTPFLYDRLGEALLAVGDSAGARTAWEKAVSLDPYDGFANTQLRKLR